MTAPTELSFDEILKFMLAHNGKVTNYELVKHFKVFLMNPDMRDEARNTFKKHVNTLAIIKNQNNEKWLILKKKYIPNNGKDSEDASDSKMPASPSVTASESLPQENTSEMPPARPPLPLQLNQDFNILTNLMQDNNLTPVSTPPVEVILRHPREETTPVKEDVPPKVYPRRKSSDKSVSEKQTSILGQQTAPWSPTFSQDLSSINEPALPILTTSRSDSMLVESDQKISVKERKQMFNRMASEGDVLKSHQPGGNFNTQSIDEDDRVSLDQKSETEPLDSKQKQWILCAAKGEYHALAKMCKENAKLVKTKDPFTTAMHWACKRGDENLVKLLAGVTRNIVNERSTEVDDPKTNDSHPVQETATTTLTLNHEILASKVDFRVSTLPKWLQGYTPLHLAVQFRHENVYRLLIEVYDADPNARDWSGRKPRQYFVHMDTSLSPGSYRKKEGFLRIGSLNVRVKKTTEAFSNFLGVGATRSSAYISKSARDRDMDRRSSEDSDQLHKSWGSADNIQKNDKLMPPPVSSKIRKRGASTRKGISSHSRSTPSTPDQPRAHIGANKEGDSDSDSAAGFHSAWRQQRASHCT